MSAFIPPNIAPAVSSAVNDLLNSPAVTPLLAPSANTPSITTIPPSASPAPTSTTYAPQTTTSSPSGSPAPTPFTAQIKDVTPSAFTPAPTSAFTFSPPASTVNDAIDSTVKAVSTSLTIIPIIFGIILFIIIAIILMCYCRSQRIKRENAEQAALALEQRQQREEQLRADQQLTPALQHVLLVSPAAPTYNSSLGTHSSIPLAVAVPSAPTADLDEAQMAYEIALQQREFERYKPAAVRASQPSAAQGYTPPVAPAPLPPPPQPWAEPQPQSQSQQQPQQQPWDDPIFVASRIPMDLLYTHSLISSGGFGEVYKGTYRGETVALKKLLPGTRRDLKQIAGFFSEIKLTASMEHERIVRYIGVAWDALSDVCVVTEFMEGGDLRAAVTAFDTIEHRPQGFDKQKATLAVHVCHALTYMHSLQPVMLHRDLKSRNILLDKTQWSAKLTDFGVSRERSDQTMTAAVGTILWMAPEVMAGDRYDDKADVFSFGIVLSELDTHEMPYADVKARMVNDSGRPLPETALIQRIMSGRVTVSFSEALRADIRALAESCVAVDPEKRPTAAQLLYELHKIMNSL